MGQFVVARARTHHELSAGKCPDVALSDAICANLLKLMMDYPLAKRLTGITRRNFASFRCPLLAASGPVAKYSATIIWHTARMPDEHPLTLRHADQARTDFAAIESALEAIYARLARLPTRSDLARVALGIIFSTAIVTTLFGWWLVAR